MTKLGLALNEAKTSVKNAREESFDFLGYTLGPRHFPAGGRWYLGASPSKKSVRAHIFRRHQADLVSLSGKHPAQMVRAAARLHRNHAAPKTLRETLKRTPSHPAPQNYSA